MKRILLLVERPQTRPGHLNWVALRDLLQDHIGQDVKVEISALSQLLLVVDGDHTRIRDNTQGFDVADFDLVVFRTISDQMEVAIAVAAYCRKHRITYVDQYVPAIGDNKVSCAFVRWEHNLPVPTSAYGPIAELHKLAQDGSMGWPLVVKANNGKKGNNNFLANSAQDVQNILTKHADIAFVMQPFIPNAGDYRILTLNYQPKLAILRRAAANTHLNNTSKGGAATLVPMDNLQPEVVELAKKAAKLERLAVAGVDIVINSHTGKPYILEVNRAPQLATGFEVDTKMQHYAAALRELLTKSPGERDTKNND